MTWINPVGGGSIAAAVVLQTAHGDPQIGRTGKGQEPWARAGVNEGRTPRRAA